MPQRPEFFWLLAVLAPVIIIIIMNYFSGRRGLLGSAGYWRPKDFYDLYTVKSFFSSLGFVVFIIFAVLSLVGFPGKEVPVSYEPAGTDIVFAVDISKSMMAEDLAPTRLDSAARIIRSVCENTPGGRFGIVVFKGRGIKMVPSTEDTEIIYSFLDFLSTDLMTSPGSNLQNGIETALSAFPDSEERKKYIILISDGEALSGEIDDVLADAVDEDVSIYTVGTGSSEGARLMVSDGSYLKDSSGDIVISRLDEAGLRYISETTNGKYYAATDSALLPNLIRLASGTVEDGGSGYRIVVKENYRFFLIISILGLMASKLIKVVKWKKYF